MTPIQFALIGPPRLTKQGKRLQLPTRKALALLAYLALSPTPHSRESLLAFFWPELDSTRGRAALRRELSRLNKALGDGWVETIGETVQITSLVQVDLIQWQKAFAEAQSVAQLQTAVTQSGGEFMAGFGLPDAPAFDAWQQQQALDWQQIRQQALHTLALRLAEDGEGETAVTTARELVSLDPFDETHQRLLMTLLAQAGQRPAALQQYEAFAQLLRTELNTTPVSETAVLAQQIRTADSEPFAPLPSPAKRPRRHWLLSVLLVVVVAGLGWRLWQQSQVDIRLAQVRQLIAQAQAAPEIADRMALVLQANAQLDSFETQAALLDTLNQMPHYLIATLPHETAVTALAFHEESQLLATGTTAGRLQLWDARTHIPLTEPVALHNGRVIDLFFSADGTLLFSSSREGSVQIWAVAERRNVGLIKHQTGHVNSLLLHPHGRWLFTGGSDGQIMVWDVGQELPNPPQLLPPTVAHGGGVSSLLLLDEGATLLSAGRDNTIRTWSFSPTSGLTQLSSMPQADVVNELAAVTKGEQPPTEFILARRDELLVWQPDASAAGMPAVLSSHTDWVEALLYYQGLYSAGRDGKIVWHDLSFDGELDSVLLAQRDAPIWDLALSAHTNLIYAAEESGQVTVWSTFPLEDRAVWLRPYAQQLTVGENVAAVEFVAEKNLMVRLVDGSLAEITDWSTQARLACCQPGPDETANGLIVVAGNGRFSITASGAELQLVANKQTMRFRLPQQVTALQLNAKEDLLAVGLADGSVQLLPIVDASFGPALVVWAGHTEPVMSLAFTADGRFLASGSWDGAIRLWEIDSGQSLLLADHKRGVAALDFTVNGRYLASGSWDDTVIIWDLSPQTWRSAAGQFMQSAARSNTR